jgi:hypothetical protein
MSWFTLKNPDFRSLGKNIRGLNLGLNTSEDQDVLLYNLNMVSTEIRTGMKHIALAEQVHKDRVREVETGGIYPETDAFVSKTPGLALAIQVADCGAVLLGDPMNRVIGAAHAGWRGAVAEIVPKTIQEMIKLGAEAKNIRVFVSPCLEVHNFEVGEEVAEHFPDHLVDFTSYDKPHVNLKGLIRDQVLDAGVQEKNTLIDDHCTIDHDELFYSYRREKELSGRMAGIIKLNKLK